MDVLCKCGAPLISRYYCLVFAVNCHNYTAKELLGGKVPFTNLNGDTADISAFRYDFWQPIDHFDPTARFPELPWKPGYYLHIDWTSGDPFTFVIWNEVGGSLEQGRQVVQNIIRPCTLQPPDLEIKNESNAEFKFKRKVATKKRKANRKDVVYGFHDIDDIDSGENDGSGLVQYQDSEELNSNVEGERTTAVANDILSDPNQNKLAPSNSNEISKSEENQDDGDDLSVEYNDDNEIEMAREINNEVNGLFLNQHNVSKSIRGSHVTKIVGLNWRWGNLYLKVEWDTGQTT